MNVQQLHLPAKQAEGVGRAVGSDSAIFFSTCWSCGEESIYTARAAMGGAIYIECTMMMMTGLMVKGSRLFGAEGKTLSLG